MTKRKNMTKRKLRYDEEENRQITSRNKDDKEENKERACLEKKNEIIKK